MGSGEKRADEGERAKMNPSIEPNKDFIKGDHPISATITLLVSRTGELNCVVLIWEAISKQSHSIICLSHAPSLACAGQSS